jgi:hypothetical protein
VLEVKGAIGCAAETSFWIQSLVPRLAYRITTKLLAQGERLMLV